MQILAIIVSYPVKVYVFLHPEDIVNFVNIKKTYLTNYDNFHPRIFNQVALHNLFLNYLIMH